MVFEPSAITVWISLFVAAPVLQTHGLDLEIVLFGTSSEDSGSQKVPQN